jgi:hypothetical protein
MKLTPVALRFTLAAIGICSFAIAPTTFGQTAAEGFSVAPGVLVDPANGVAYLMTPKRQVEAVTLKDGEVVWSSSAAARPIAIRGDRIIAQAESAEASSTLTLVALDTSSGEPAGTETIDLGPGVVTSIDDGKEHEFVVGTEDADTKTGPVLWRYFEQKRTGPAQPPAPVFERFGALNVTETASMAPASGGFSKRSGRPPYSQPRVSRPVSERPAPETIIFDLGSGLRYRPDGVQVPSPAGPTSPNPTAADAPGGAVTVAPPSGGLIVTEGRPGEEFPPTRRIPGDQFADSIDGRHIAASEFAGKIEAAEPYRWTIYTRGTFEVVASYMAQTSLAPFVLTEDRVLYMRQPYQRREGGTLHSYPLALVARDAESGRIVWTHPVRDTRYQGPIPEQAR